MNELDDSLPVRRKILLVEDDRISRESLAYLLRGLGHEVREVWSAEDGKAALSAFTPNVALLDVRLPGLPGDAFAVFLRHKCPDVRIVFISGEYQVDDVENFGKDVDFLAKPVDFDRLLALIGK